MSIEGTQKGILVGRLNAEEACAVVTNAVREHHRELDGYDYIVIVRAKDDGRASMLSSLAENETVRSTLRFLLDHMAAGGRNLLRLQ